MLLSWVRRVLDGVPGLAHMLTLLQTEFEMAMALFGCATIGDINPALIWNEIE